MNYKIVDQHAEVIGETPYNLEEQLVRIELCGRKCYKSEGKITPESARPFAEKMIGKRHLTVPEHSNLVYRTLHAPKFPTAQLDTIKCVYDSPYIHKKIINGQVYVWGNFRAFMEWSNCYELDQLAITAMPAGFIQIVDPKEVPLECKRVTVFMYTDRAVLGEITRHRPDIVFSVESQRYVRYEDIKFIRAYWEKNVSSDALARYYQGLGYAADTYLKLRKQYKLKAQEARNILPNATACDMAITAGLLEWNHLLNLRTTMAAYPQFRNVANPLKETFEKNGWLF